MGNVFVANISTQLVPTKDYSNNTPVLMQQTTASSTAVAMLTTAVNAGTTHVFWKLSGGDAIMTMDGSAPVSSPLHGFIVTSGSDAVWAKETAAAAKFIRKDSTDCVISIQELTR